MTCTPIRAAQHPTPADLLRFNQRTYRRHPIMEAEASLLRAWRLYRTWAHGREEDSDFSCHD